MNDKINLFDPDTGIKLEVPMDKVRGFEDNERLEAVGEMTKLPKSLRDLILKEVYKVSKDGGIVDEKLLTLVLSVGAFSAKTLWEALQSKVTELEERVKAYEAALDWSNEIFHLDKCSKASQLHGVGKENGAFKNGWEECWLWINKQALKEQAGEGE